MKAELLAPRMTSPSPVTNTAATPRPILKLEAAPMIDGRSFRFVEKAIDLPGVQGGTKLLSQFNSAESLIQSAGDLTKVNAGLQSFVKGDGPSIFRAITEGSVGTTSRGGVIMKDGITIFNHFSTKTGVYTIDINKAGQMYKIRIIP